MTNGPSVLKERNNFSYVNGNLPRVTFFFISYPKKTQSFSKKDLSDNLNNVPVRVRPYTKSQSEGYLGSLSRQVRVGIRNCSDFDHLYSISRDLLIYF